LRKASFFLGQFWSIYVSNKRVICNNNQKNDIKFMNILRKISGVSLLIISLLLILATISSSIKTITEAHKESGGERIGYILGDAYLLDC
jgi:hypothetical protein